MKLENENSFEEDEKNFSIKDNSNEYDSFFKNETHKEAFYILIKAITEIHTNVTEINIKIHIETNNNIFFQIIVEFIVSTNFKIVIMQNF